MKISGFKFINEEKPSSFIPVEWMSFEALNEGKFSFKSDVVCFFKLNVSFFANFKQCYWIINSFWNSTF